MREVLFPQCSNRQTWAEYFTFSDEDTAEPIRLLDKNGLPFFDFTVSLHLERPIAAVGSWRRSQFYDAPLPVGGYGCNLQATLQNGGVTIIDTGVVYVRFNLDQMRGLAPGQYRLSLLLGDEHDGLEIVRGVLPVVCA